MATAVIEGKQGESFEAAEVVTEEVTEEVADEAQSEEE